MKQVKKLFVFIAALSCLFLGAVGVSAASISEAQVNGAVEWARNADFNYGRSGQSFSGYCLAFVQYAYSSQGVTVGVWGTAQNAGNNLIINGTETDLNPPKGALVFFKNLNGMGHIGISLGDGTYIHAAANCKAITQLTSYNSSFALQYRGWGYPGVGNILPDGGRNGYASNTGSITVNTADTRNISETNATVYGNVSYSGIRPSEVGIYFGTSPDNMSKAAKDSITHNKNPFDMWYDLNGEAGKYLSAGTTYYYKCYAIQNGNEVTGETRSFTTLGSSVQAPIPVSENTYTAYVSGTDGSLAINSTPSASTYIGEIPEGASVTVYPDKASGNWYWVSYNGISGYSFGKYLVTSSAPVSAPVSENTYTAYVSGTDGSLAINSAPSASSYIGEIPEGAAVTVYPDKASGNWYWVSYNGISGYSYGKYLIETNSGQSSGSSEWKFPVPNYSRISQGFSSSHSAIDIAANIGTEVYASKSGTIVKKYTGCNNFSREHGQCQSGGVCSPNHGYSTASGSAGYCNDGFGNGYIIRHDDGTWAEYAHMNYLSDSLYEGGYVTQGTYLGGVSSTGVSTGPHLHFGVRWGDSDSFWRSTAFNPLDYMSAG